MAETRAPRLGWGRVADYLFGRNALIGVASFMLLIISGYATWHGMRDFIIGVSATPASQGQSLPGGMSISNDALVIAVVVALTFLMWLMLRETFGAKRHVRERLVTFPLYVFLAVWSIGFGYGFWWSLISGEEATRTGLAGLQEDARDASAVVAARLDAVRGAARQRGELVGWPDGARGDERGQLRHSLRRRTRAPLQRAAQRARFDQHVARGHDAVLVRALASRRRAAQAKCSRTRRQHCRGAAEGLRGQGIRHSRTRAQHRRAQQPARQVDRRGDARDRRRGCDCPRRRRLLLLRPDAGGAAAAGRGPGRATRRAQAARSRLQ